MSESPFVKNEASILLQNSCRKKDAYRRASGSKIRFGDPTCTSPVHSLSTNWSRENHETHPLPLPSYLHMLLKDRKAQAGEAEHPSPNVFPGKHLDTPLVEPRKCAAKVMTASAVTATDVERRRDPMQKICDYLLNAGGVKASKVTPMTSREQTHA